MDKLTIENLKDNNLTFTLQFAEFRKYLGFDPFAIELKNREDKGIISIKTRGQLGLSSKISALTSFNKYWYTDPDAMRTDLLEKIAGDKTLRFPKDRLMSGLDIVKKGGHVTMIPTEQNFYLTYDNRRTVLANPIKSEQGTFFDTVPCDNVKECLFNRGLAKIDSSKYSKKHPWVINILKDTSTFQRTFIRNLVRLMYQEPLKFNRDKFTREQIVDIILQIFDVRISVNYISHQKRSPFLPRAVNLTQDTLSYSKRLKTLFPGLDVQIFFKDQLT